MQDPRQRLGAHAGADEVKQHPWFDGVNWALGRADQERAAEAQSIGSSTVRRQASAKSNLGAQRRQAPASFKRATVPAAAAGGLAKRQPSVTAASKDASSGGGEKAKLGCFMFRSKGRGDA